MRIDFKPQRLVSSMVLEEKIPNGIRRVLQTEGKVPKTIDMELSSLDSLGNAYPKGYYVSSYKVYNTKNSQLLKSMRKEVTDSQNSVITLAEKNVYGKYDKSLIVRNRNFVTKSELTK